jgi:hypothetical protein
LWPAVPMQTPVELVESDAAIGVQELRRRGDRFGPRCLRCRAIEWRHQDHAGRWRPATAQPRKAVAGSATTRTTATATRDRHAGPAARDCLGTIPLVWRSARECSSSSIAAVSVAPATRQIHTSASFARSVIVVVTRCVRVSAWHSLVGRRLVGGPCPSWRQTAHPDDTTRR